MIIDIFDKETKTSVIFQPDINFYCNTMFKKYYCNNKGQIEMESEASFPILFCREEVAWYIKQARKQADWYKVEILH